MNKFLPCLGLAPAGAHLQASSGGSGSIATTGAAVSFTGAATGTPAPALAASSKDSAVLVTLAPGAYTAQVTGANDSTGAGMVEIYEVK